MMGKGHQGYGMMWGGNGYYSHMDDGPWMVTVFQKKVG